MVEGHNFFFSGCVFLFVPIFCLVLQEGLQFECRFLLSFFALHHPKPELLRYEKLYIYIYMYGYWVVSGPHGTAFINGTCMFEGSYIYLPSTHIYQRHS